MLIFSKRLTLALLLLPLVVAPAPIFAKAAGEDGTLTIYACNGVQLVQKQVQADDATAKSLLRAGHAVWSNGRIDHQTVDAIAEGRGIWSATHLTTLAQLAGTSIPVEILTAIAIKESGIKGRFWPWTINWRGKGFYLESRQKAIEAAKYLISQGVLNFDVSSMQVNWRWHKHRFDSIDSAFDPVINMQVAAKIIMENFQQTGDWSLAIARYHSRTPTTNKPYLNSVIQHLVNIQKIPPKEPEKKLCLSD